MTSVEQTRDQPLTETEVSELVENVTGMALLYGVQKKDRTSQEFRVQPVPFTLFPSPLPRKTFNEAKRLQTHFQTLMYKVAQDHEFLYDCFKSILPVDDFIRGLWNIYDTVRKEGTQQISFMMTRNDFMMESQSDVQDDLSHKQADLCLKQVEMNIFAAGSGGVMKALADLHRYTLTITDTPFRSEQLPTNHPTLGLARGVCKAWEMLLSYEQSAFSLHSISIEYSLFSRGRFTSNLGALAGFRAVILFVVDIPEPTQDQRWLERDIFNTNPGVRVIYRKFSQLLKDISLTTDKKLFVGNREVAVVYFRCGYIPIHYPTNKEFDLRLTIEQSRAIKCPSMALHLAGCKKVQEALSQPGVLEKFLKDPGAIADLRRTFVKQVALDKDMTLVKTAKEAPNDYVLKPQREGGGNNLFGEDLFSQIDNLYNSPEAPSWILMERIKSCWSRNRLVRSDLDPCVREVVWELGIYGVHIGTPAGELVNYECGYLLRTKPKNSDEGGLVNGMACLDTVLLAD